MEEQNLQPNVPEAQPSSAAYAAPPVQAVKPAPVRRKSTSRDLAMAILTGVMCFVMTDSFIRTGTLGLGFMVGAVLFLAVELWYISPVIRRRSIYGIVYILLYTAGCVSLVFNADHLLKFLTLLCLMMLTTCMLTECMDLRTWAPNSFRSVTDHFYVACTANFLKIPAGMYGLFHSEKKADSTRKAGVGKALLGLAIALPLIVILVFLLYSGDEAFSGMLNGIKPSKIETSLLSLLAAIPVFIILFSRLFGLRDISRKPSGRSGKGFDPIVLLFFLLGISLVYLAYLFSQLAYFFNGFLGFLPKDFTYAEYARRGFFELTAVSVINIVTVILGSALCRKKDGKLPLGVKLAMLFLCVFSLVLAFTEVAKMKMYMDSYGLTRLRILTTLFTAFLAVVFVTLIVRLFVVKTPYIRIAAIVGAVMVIALSFINIDGVIAGYNMQAYREGSLKTIDVRAITVLNDAAVPALIELASDDDPEVADKAVDNLYLRWKKLHEIDKWDYNKGRYSEGALKDYDLRGYNLTSYQARDLLLKNEEMIIQSQQN